MIVGTCLFVLLGAGDVRELLGGVGAVPGKSVGCGGRRMLFQLKREALKV